MEPKLYDLTNEEHKKMFSKKIAETRTEEDKYIALKLEDGAVLVFPIDGFVPEQLEKCVVEKIALGKDYHLAVNKIKKEEVQEEIVKKAEEDLKDARTLKWAHNEQDTINKIIQFRMELQEGLKAMEESLGNVKNQEEQYDALIEYKKVVYDTLKETQYADLAKKDLETAELHKKRFSGGIDNANRNIETIKNVLGKTEYFENEKGEAEFKHFEAIGLAVEILDIIQASRK